MGKPKSPKPPDPRETAAGQTGTNVSTAVANALLGNVNQITPEGTLTYEPTGSYDWFDEYTRTNYEIPTFTAEVSLSPEQMELYRLGTQTEANLANIGVEQSGKIRELLGTPVDLSNEATEARLFELGRSRLDPTLAENENTLRQRLADQGIQEGSRAFDRSMRGFYEGRNDAYNQLLLSGRGQAVQELLTERNQPINEITALLSGSQVSQPNFINANMPNIPTTDVAGIINQDYQNRLAQSQADRGFFGDIAGGLFQLGSSFII